MTGLDRNQPIRQYIARTGCRLLLRHLDPGVIYHWLGRRIIRGSSVESWIETCSEVFPGEGVRDFWETIWNVAVSAWDFIDKLGKEPWQRPNPGFPFLNPGFWRGARRTRLLFADTRSFINAFAIQDPSAFLEWVETVVRFQYGAGVESVPLGMVALALNAPSESYLFEGGPGNRTDGPKAGQLGESRGGWRVPFEPGEQWEAETCPIHQVFLTPPLAGLAAQSAVLVRPTGGGGTLYLRVQPDLAVLPEETAVSLERAVAACLGQAWGSLNRSGAEKVSALPFHPGLPVESDWPWLGCVRTLLHTQQTEGTE